VGAYMKPWMLCFRGVIIADLDDASSIMNAFTLLLRYRSNMKNFVFALLSFGALACRVEPSSPEVFTEANFNPSRSRHFFTKPFPDDSLLDTQGRPQLSGFPTGSGLGSLMVGSYASRVSKSVFGYGLNTPIYFSFSDSVDLRFETRFDPPTPNDKVMLFELDTPTPALQPIELRYLEDPQGDPFFPEHTLIAAPVLGAPLKSGTRYGAVVLNRFTDQKRAPINRSKDFEAGFTNDASPAIEHQTELKAALASLGVAEDEVLVATTFTTQDILTQRDLIKAKVEAAISGPNADDFLTLTDFKEVTQLQYTQGVSPKGVNATIVTVKFADGTSNDEYQTTNPGDAVNTIDLDAGNWPTRVFEGNIHTTSLQKPDDRPFASEGFGLAADLSKETGKFDFSNDGQLQLNSTPEPEEMRVIVQLPRTLGTTLASCRAFVWDHGTGGSAYEAVHRSSFLDDNAEPIIQKMSEEGFCIISRDQPLYGRRFELVDGGFDSYLAVYNIANLTAFRDNLRQASVDGYVLQRFIERRLPQALVDAGLIDNVSRINTANPRKFGHSLGSVTSHLVLASFGDENPYEAAFMSGSGGFLATFFTDLGLGANVDQETLDNAIETLTGLGVELDLSQELSAAGIIGALAEIPIPARANIDRLHPIIALFQTVMDPADPINYASTLTKPETIIMGVGDLQVPNSATRALVRALPNATLIECNTTFDYDPHSCYFREAKGLDVLNIFLQ
jgi:hypothetical protein